MKNINYRLIFSKIKKGTVLFILVILSNTGSSQFALGLDFGINIGSSSYQGKILNTITTTNYIGLPIEYYFTKSSSVTLKISHSKNIDYYYYTNLNGNKFQGYNIKTEIGFVRTSVLYSKRLFLNKRWFLRSMLGGGIGVVSNFKALVAEDDPYKKTIDVVGTQNYNRKTTEPFVEFGLNGNYFITKKINLSLNLMGVYGIRDMNIDNKPVIKNLPERYKNSNFTNYNSANYGFSIGINYHFLTKEN